MPDHYMPPDGYSRRCSCGEEFDSWRDLDTHVGQHQLGPFGRIVVNTVGEGIYSGNPNNVDEVIECAQREGWLGALTEELALEVNRGSSTDN